MLNYRWLALPAALAGLPGVLRVALDLMTLPEDLGTAKTLLNNLLGSSWLPQGWWALSLLFAGIALSIWPDALRTALTAFPSHRVPLAEAARLTYEKTIMADRYGHDPKNIALSKTKLHVYALMIDGKSGLLNIWGQSAPSRLWESVPKETLAQPSLLSDDFSMIAGNGIAPSIEWKNLSIKKSDLRQHIDRLITNGRLP